MSVPRHRRTSPSHLRVRLRRARPSSPPGCCRPFCPPAALPPPATDTAAAQFIVIVCAAADVRGGGKCHRWRRNERPTERASERGKRGEIAGRQASIASSASGAVGAICRTRARKYMTEIGYGGLFGDAPQVFHSACTRQK